MQQLESIKSQIVDSYKSVYGNSIEEIFLYGSYARGDYDGDSDIDFTAIVKGDRSALQHKLKSVWDMSADIGLENDVVITMIFILSHPRMH
jgi:predicted nucleotidyltransferase